MLQIFTPKVHESEIKLRYKNSPKNQTQKSIDKKLTLMTLTTTTVKSPTDSLIKTITDKTLSTTDISPNRKPIRFDDIILKWKNVGACVAVMEPEKVHISHYYTLTDKVINMSMQMILKLLVTHTNENPLTETSLFVRFQLLPLGCSVSIIVLR